MTETTVAKKKPLSLNDRMRLLSATHSHRPPPPSSSRFPRDEDDQPKFNLESSPKNDAFADDDGLDFPRFDGFADFLSTSDATKLSEENVQGSVDEDDTDDGYPNLADNVNDDVESHQDTKENPRDSVEDDGEADDSVFSFSAVADVNSPPRGKPKAEKIRIEGRRRLCKLSTQSSDRDAADVKEESQHIFDVSDFSSPPPKKDADCAGGEIRDILNDLTSRLEFMSIEKKTMPRPIDQKVVPLGDEFSDEVPDKVMDQKKDKLAADFEKPSVSHRHSAYNFSEDVGLAEVNKPSKTVPRKEPKTVSRKVIEKSSVSQRKVSYKLKDDNDDDDCVEVGSHAWKKADQLLDGVTNKGRVDSHAVDIIEDDELILKDDDTIVMKDPRSSYTLPAKIGKMLYPHQREGLKWLWSLHCQGKGGILGDDMGLGKTMQIAGYLAGLFGSRLIKRVMIVAPKTLIPHWIKELSVVGLSKMIKEYFGTCPKLRKYELQYVLQDRGILLTTYDIVRNNAKQLCGDDYYDDDSDAPLWDYMVLDEGHLIKNPSTQRAKSLLEIPCSHRIIISGTPIQNNLKELWALFNFCCPDLLGDKKWFKEKYENPILRGNDKRASERDKRVGSMVAKELRERIQPYFLRRMKNEVFSTDGPAENAKLSQKNEMIVWLRLTSSQRHLYEAFLRSEIVLSAFDGSPLAAITILKKICDHPYLLTQRAAEDLLEGMDSMLNQEDRSLAEKLATHAADLTDEDDFKEKHTDVSCKISFILSLLERLIPEGHNVLIFSQTRKMLNLIQESLVTHGFEFLRIDGTTKANDRLKVVNEFQEGHGAPIFLLTSQVGGLGLTLTRADRVIVVDPAWNPSTDSQSVDRAYRIGQKKDVIVYRLITSGTIEEKMYRMQVFKGGLFKTATEHKEQTRYFTRQDLKELFSLPKDGFDVSPTQLQLHEEHGDQIALSDYLKDHIKLLESFGIGGVSHHSLLYSKSDPTPPMPAEEEAEVRRNATTYNYNRQYCGSSTEAPVNGSQYAFKPKDVNIQRVNSSPQTPDSKTESEIQDRIKRLSQLLSNKAAVSKLPDKGERLRKQMSELAVELENLITPEKNNEVIEVDDLTDKMKSSFLV